MIFVARILKDFGNTEKPMQFEYLASTSEMRSLWLIGAYCWSLPCCLPSSKLHCLILTRKRGVSRECTAVRPRAASGVESAWSQSHMLLIDFCPTFCACIKPSVGTAGLAMGNHTKCAFLSNQHPSGWANCFQQLIAVTVFPSADVNPAEESCIYKTKNNTL